MADPQITAEQRQQQYTASLAEATEIVKMLKDAYKQHLSGSGLTKRYKIKDREMEFVDLADLLKQICHWENEVRKLEASVGLSPRRSGRIVVRF